MLHAQQSPGAGGMATFARLLLLTLALGHPLIYAASPVCPGNQSEPAANAGCLATRQGRLLVIRQRNGRWTIPGGTHKRGESARCTAYRETLEETGLKMHVGTLLKTLDNGFHLFHCHADGNTAPKVKWTNLEVHEASWTLPEDIPKSHWRYPGQLPMLLVLMQELDDRE